MNKQSPEIIAIRKVIENTIERKIKAPSDFIFLSESILERVKEYISPTTLKRTWGYIEGAETIRNSTLVILAKYAGYSGWDNFIKELNEKSEIESGLLSDNVIDARNLNINDIIEVSWSPNRYCSFKHLGECMFEVKSAVNSKLMVGDTFSAVFFIENEPLYLNNLEHGSKKIGSYLCGSKNGLTRVKLLVG